jgi:hypothetical protein
MAGAKRGGQGRGLIINHLPLWERVRVRGKIDFCNCLLCYTVKPLPLFFKEGLGEITKSILGTVRKKAR